jgi:predicted dehydrogenase
MTEKVKIGVVGCGNISGIYLEQMQTFDILEVYAAADLIEEKVQRQTKRYGVPRIMTHEEMLADPNIEVILNITQPDAHADVALKTLRAGKSVYNEKPLCIRREEAREMLRIAAEKGLRVGCAPDTFLGAGLQTCRKLIDEGAIGEPIGATAFMTNHGHESWHPDPEFYYMVGGGPMLDMGPYYLTALVSMLGPVQRVTGTTRITFPEREITSEPKRGKKIHVEVPTYITGLLEFGSGAQATILTTFDVWKANLPRIEIYGSKGTLQAPDPNTFGGPVGLWKADSKEWEEIPLLPIRSQNSRSLGLADMAHAIRSGRAHRANGEMAYHVLDIMHSIHDAAREGCHITMSSSCTRPAPMPVDLPQNLLD